MTGGSATRPFQAALAEISDIHKQELDSQRLSYEKRLKEVHDEKEYYRTLLAVVQKHSSSCAEAEVAAKHRIGAEDVGSIKCSVDSGPSPDASIGAAAWLVGAAGAMLGGTAPAATNPKGPRWLWEVVGGEDKGGIVVRTGDQIDSRQNTFKLATGSLVEEIGRNGDRLRFWRITGAGPRTGWISTKASGKDLAVLADRPPLRPRQPPPVTVGPYSMPPLPTVLLFMEVALPENILRMHKELPVVKEGMDMVGRVMSMERVMCSPHRANTILTHLSYFVAGLAALEKLKFQRPEVVGRAGAVAGSGVGQYLALCAAGVLSFEDGLKLAKLRITAICDASDLREQRSISVGPIEDSRIHALCLQVCKMEGTGAICQISAYLSKRAFWVSGTRKAIDLMEEKATEAGANVFKLPPLAAHTSLMAPAQAEFTAGLEEALPRMKAPLHTVWMNATGEPVRPGADPAAIVADLKHELLRPMLLWQSIDAMCREGIAECYHVNLMTDHYEPLASLGSGVSMTSDFAAGAVRYGG